MKELEMTLLEYKYRINPVARIVVNCTLTTVYIN